MSTFPRQSFSCHEACAWSATCDTNDLALLGGKLWFELMEPLGLNFPWLLVGVRCTTAHASMVDAPPRLCYRILGRNTWTKMAQMSLLDLCFARCTYIAVFMGLQTNQRNDNELNEPSSWPSREIQRRPPSKWPAVSTTWQRQSSAQGAASNVFRCFQVIFKWGMVQLHILCIPGRFHTTLYFIDWELTKCRMLILTIQLIVWGFPICKP